MHESGGWNRRRRVISLVAASTWVGVACGTTDASPRAPSATEDAAPPADDAQAPVAEAGSASEAAPSVTEAEACSRWSRARCDDVARCSRGALVALFRDDAGCVERVTSECHGWVSAGLEPRRLDACATALSSRRCDELAIPPACDFRGTRPTGASCNIAADCASGVCSNDYRPGTCGRCEARGRLGDDCTGEGAKRCVGDVWCFGVCSTFVPRGGQCAGTNLCIGNLRCLEGVCTDGTPEGAPCTSGSACAGGWCTNGICGPAEIQSTGDECRAHFCIGGATCGPDGTCLEPAPDGAPCDETAGVGCRYPATCEVGRCRLPGVVCNGA